MARTKAKSAVTNIRPRNGKPKLRLVYPTNTPNDEKEYLRRLHAIIDDIFTEAANKHQWTWSQLAVQAGLSYQTVTLLGDRVTRFPRFHTIHKLAKAVGWNLVTTSTRTRKPKIKIAG